MSKRMFVLLKEPVTLELGDVPAGEVIELTELSAQALIKEDKAVEATPDEETAEALKKLEEGGGQGENDQDPDLDPEAEEEKVRQALNDQYTLEEMKPVAKEAGVDFPYDVTKKALVAAIIEQGKAEALLK